MFFEKILRPLISTYVKVSFVSFFLCVSIIAYRMMVDRKSATISEISAWNNAMKHLPFFQSQMQCSQESPQCKLDDAPDNYSRITSSSPPHAPSRALPASPAQHCLPARSGPISACAACFTSPACFWSVVNMCYCVLLVCARLLQRWFFGGVLRASEQSLVMGAAFWHLLLYRVVFMCGILCVDSLGEVLLWAGWSAVLVFLHVFTSLTRDRLDFLLLTSGSTLRHSLRSRASLLQTHTQQPRKLSLLLLLLLLISSSLSGIAAFVGARFCLHLMFFMLAELCDLLCRIAHLLLYYGVQCCVATSSLGCHGNNWKRVLNNFVRFLLHGNKSAALSCAAASPAASPALVDASIALYYVELYAGVVLRNLLGLAHHTHMLWWNECRINVTSLLLALQLKSHALELAAASRKHLAYRRIVAALKHSFPLFRNPSVVTTQGGNTEEEAAKRGEGVEEVCAICWEALTWCRQLHCEHKFHDACIRSWLLQNPVCPLCHAHLERRRSSFVPHTQPPHINTPHTIATSPATHLNVNEEAFEEAEDEVQEKEHDLKKEKEEEEEKFGFGREGEWNPLLLPPKRVRTLSERKLDMLECARDRYLRRHTDQLEQKQRIEETLLT